jgi:mannose-6-phosphate isomerase-like protein (cupin superfamily)
MKKVVVGVCGLVMLACAVSAQAPGVSHWTGAQLKALEREMPPKMNASKSASQQLVSVATHLIQLSYREASGEAEVHESVADVFVVQSGRATLAVGGKVVNGKTTAAGEIRGSSIDGAQLKELGPGDVVSIPAGTPHQVLMKTGTKLSYLVVKVLPPQAR